MNPALELFGDIGKFLLSHYFLTGMMVALVAMIQMREQLEASVARQEPIPGYYEMFPVFRNLMITVIYAIHIMIWPLMMVTMVAVFLYKTVRLAYWLCLIALLGALMLFVMFQRRALDFTYVLLEHILNATRRVHL